VPSLDPAKTFAQSALKYADRERLILSNALSPIILDQDFNRCGPLPQPHHRAAVENAWERWRDDAAQRLQDGGDDQGAQEALGRFMLAVADDPRTKPMIEVVFGNSPFLTVALLKEPAFLRQILTHGPTATWQQEVQAIDQALATETDIKRLMKGLRVGKRRLALLTALADISGLWSLEQVTEALADYASQALNLASIHLLRAGAQGGHITLPHPQEPCRDSGFVVLGMGKLGGRELNYSSDIDIICLYDDEKITYTGRKSVGEFFIRLTKDLVRIMDERTGDGYVFRTDLRLRPDPGSTAVCLSTDAAETYYESFGQNWERAAMIKVRAVAGDLDRGDAFIRHLRPFVWRKSLDFYAIQDIHSIKRQINAHRACGVVAVAGHNIKLGRGGIREIEFFAQTQQLIWGGREPQVRTSRTLTALWALVEQGHVQAPVAEELEQAYRFLRALEHRLQMIDDAQTQTLPADADKLAHVATFFGYPDPQAFDRAVRQTLCSVENHYAALFEDAPSLSEEQGNLVFTGGEDDPDTLRTLQEMGFTNPQAVANTVRGWHHGRYRALRSTRAKELLTELQPTLLRALGATAQPDQAFLRFDSFLGALPAGVQIFSIFHANPSLLGLVAEIMGDAPRLADILARRSNTLDAVMTPGFFDAPLGCDDLGTELDQLLAQAAGYEEILDLSRLWANGRKFQIGVQTLRGLLDARQAGQALTTIADTVLGRLLAATQDEFAHTYGHVPGGSVAVIAMGKAGGGEMTATSDLDLITVYDVEPGPDGEAATASDGRRELSVADYYIRLTQRFINAITALTREGALYEVDMRLRPSGSKGPLAVSLISFSAYNAKEAWTWEHMALTRGRVVCGPPGLTQRINAAIAATLGSPRDPDRLLVDVADMRALMARERKPANSFDVKLSRGGLVDVEFIVQYLLLRHASDHPAILNPSIAGALVSLRDAGLLSAQDAATLDQAHALWLNLQGMLRHSISGPFSPEDASAGLKDRLARCAGEPNMEQLESRMAATYAAVYALFTTLIENPAEAARARLAEKTEETPS
jgi:glutamate-ammonia-ligase adenylyltransferase